MTLLFVKNSKKTQDGSMPPGFRIEFYSPRLGNRQSAYVMAKTKNEAINKFFKEKPQYKGKIEIKSVTMLNARELPKQKALKIGDSKKTQDNQNKVIGFMDRVVKSFDDNSRFEVRWSSQLPGVDSGEMIVKAESEAEAIKKAQRRLVAAIKTYFFPTFTIFNRKTEKFETHKTILKFNFSNDRIIVTRQDGENARVNLYITKLTNDFIVYAKLDPNTPHAKRERLGLARNYKFKFKANTYKEAFKLANDKLGAKAKYYSISAGNTAYSNVN